MKRNIVVGIVLFAGVIMGLARIPAAPPAPVVPSEEKPGSTHTSPSPTQPASPSPARANLSSATSASSPTTSLVSAKVTDEPSGGSPKTLLADGQRYPLRTYKPLLTPNDPSATQWWTQSTGLESAWGYGAGSYTPTVAVIDTGVALQHQEFANRWYANSGERGATTTQAASKLNCTDAGLPLTQACNTIDDDFDGIVDNETGATTVENPSRLNCTGQGLPLDKSCNRIDDDGNGYVDDVTGWDFSNYDNNVQAGEVTPGGSGTVHGSMVTGILAASGNNGVGIAGVNWSAKILPLQALDDNGYGNTLTVARALRYAADQHADVISISLGTDLDDPYLHQAIDYALAAGSMVVAASGNDGCDCVSYPARFPEVLAVGASNSSGNPASFSNYGAELDILAPGQNMTTTTWTAANPTNSYASGVSGTSFATPYVSGLLALAKSHQPAASWGELTAALLEKSDRRALTASTPRSDTTGYGYAQAGALLARVTTPATPAMRYQLGPITPADTLDSYRAHQCESNIPAAPLYELTRSGQIRYTVSKLVRYQALQTGWLETRMLHVCTGLPSDQPAVLRTINLLTEINNSYTKG